MNSHHLDYHQWPLYVVCYLLVILHHLYNKGLVLTFWPHSMPHKQAHPTYQQDNTRITTQAHTSLIKQITTQRLKKLMPIYVILIIGLNFILHQPQSPFQGSFYIVSFLSTYFYKRKHLNTHKTHFKSIQGTHTIPNKLKPYTRRSTILKLTLLIWLNYLPATTQHTHSYSDYPQQAFPTHTLQYANHLYHQSHTITPYSFPNYHTLAISRTTNPQPPHQLLQP